VSDEHKSLRNAIGGIKDWWLGDNTDWQKKLTEGDTQLMKMFKEDLKLLFFALDSYAVQEQNLKDEIEYLRKKCGQ